MYAKCFGTHTAPAPANAGVPHEMFAVSTSLVKACATSRPKESTAGLDPNERSARASERIFSQEPSHLRGGAVPWGKPNNV